MKFSGKGAFIATVILLLRLDDGGDSTSKNSQTSRYLTQIKRVSLVFLLLFFFGLQSPLIFGQFKTTQPVNPFPSTIQFSAPPKDRAASGSYPDLLAQHKSIQNIALSGFSNFWIYNFSDDSVRKLLNYAESIGMGIDYMTSGFEGFGRNLPPKTSVYSPQYADEVSKRIDSGLASIKKIRNLSTLFPFQDEPFHAGPASFDFSRYAQAEFLKRYGYSMPLNADSAESHPRKWLDLLNFQSNIFRDGWIKVYGAVKAFDPRPKVVMTHDSHNSFGAGVHSNSRIAIDDIFHWGGDFADIYAYDIYPYMTFDYRYGDLGKLPKPRISQMHYTISQLRNLTTSYGKELGFWVGTYSEKWFDRFRGIERKNAFWSERELSYTAIAQGANFLISPSNYNTLNIPLDTLHWKDYSNSMKIIQKAGKGILETQKVKAKACFLFPRTQYLQLQEEYYNVGISFELFLRAFGELDIIHEEQVTDDNLKGYKVLILADVKLLPEKVAEKIAGFVRKGGILIADCVPQMGEYKQPISEMKEIFGVGVCQTNRIQQQGQWVPFVNLPPKMSFPPDVVSTESLRSDFIKGTAFGSAYDFKIISPRNCQLDSGSEVLKMESGKPALITNHFGRGKSYLFGFCIQDTYFRTWKDNDINGRRNLRSLISAVFKDANISSHICSSNPDIEASIRTNKEQGYVFIINHEATDSMTTVTLHDLPFSVAKIIDIETEMPVAFEAIKGGLCFKVEAARTKLLKITH